jgi:hypothetical protein
MKHPPTPEDLALCSHVTPDDWVRLGFTIVFAQTFSEKLGSIPPEQIGTANVAFVEMFREACEAMAMACKDMWQRALDADPATLRPLAAKTADAAKEHAQRAISVGGP